MRSRPSGVKGEEVESREIWVVRITRGRFSDGVLLGGVILSSRHRSHSLAKFAGNRIDVKTATPANVFMINSNEFIKSASKLIERVHCASLAITFPLVYRMGCTAGGNKKI
jgi:hypothetical protein